ncbi:MAG: hypothetical protein JNL62_05995 [Bryobacterales bacterium]|nr:hypothetical protein [Bryobacterales bacterium]
MAYQKNRLGHLLSGWRPPVGVRVSRPRDVTYTATGWVVAGCLWMVALGGFAALTGLGAKANREAAETTMLAEQGVETNGSITRLWRGKGDSKQPYAAYEFDVNGQKYTGRVKVRLSAWRMLQLGGQWRIRYVPANPKLHHPVHIPPSPTPAFVPYLAGSACFSLVALLAWLVRREKYLLAEGRVAPGVITRVNKADSNKHRFEYEFPLLSGGVGRGKTSPSHQSHNVGDRVCVVYLPDEPSRNALFPLSLVKQAGHTPQEKRKPHMHRRLPMLGRKATA